MYPAYEHYFYYLFVVSALLISGSHLFRPRHTVWGSSFAQFTLCIVIGMGVGIGVYNHFPVPSRVRNHSEAIHWEFYSLLLGGAAGILYYVGLIVWSKTVGEKAKREMIEATRRSKEKDDT